MCTWSATRVDDNKGILSRVVSEFSLCIARLGIRVQPRELNVYPSAARGHACICYQN